MFLGAVLLVGVALATAVVLVPMAIDTLDAPDFVVLVAGVVLVSVIFVGVVVLVTVMLITDVVLVPVQLCVLGVVDCVVATVELPVVFATSCWSLRRLPHRRTRVGDRACAARV